ncbi:ankyrin repeat-containing domain protein [Phialemonium atrogriseum]|uniref:Ankyrin repeat-containing domain protein n=1 Tax=Phialemonium atrogriseum TaxID=1093897 RepID=A0AAJ0BY66_9PEZI|nr:ankyrin repeat-containing domain protein [Phialemonium atrogriseum]KAK1765274.1 ankyrin repeat-containing domain protein [Phialemonium atrogriseum]
MEKPSPTTSTNRLSTWVSKLKSANTIVKTHDRLRWAAINGNREEISKLLKEHSRFSTLTGGQSALDVNAQDKLGRSALHWAAARGKAECASELTLHEKANRLLKDKDGRTPLHEAVIRGHEAIVNILLENQIPHAVDRGDNHGRTALHWAAENGNEEMVQFLIDRDADILKEDKCKDTALHMAARNGHQTIVQTLVKKNAPVEAATVRLAAENNHQEVAKFLIQNKDPEEEDGVIAVELAQKWPGVGEILLLRAAGEGHEAVVKLLLEGGASVDAKDRDGQTPLWRAAWGGHEAVVKLLLEGGASVDAKDQDGQTPLWRAAGEGHEAVVKLLLEGGASVDAKDQDGQTPLWWAAREGHEAVAKLLQDASKMGDKVN